MKRIAISVLLTSAASAFAGGLPIAVSGSNAVSGAHAGAQAGAVSGSRSGAISGAESNNSVSVTTPVSVPVSVASPVSVSAPVSVASPVTVSTTVEAVKPPTETTANIVQSGSVRTAPDVIVPAAASGPCTGNSGGGGVSGLGWGVGFSAAAIDPSCTLREGVRVMLAMIPFLAEAERIEARAMAMDMLRAMHSAALAASK